MKKIYYILIAAILPLATWAQNGSQLRVEQQIPARIKAENREIYYEGDSVIISLKIDAYEITIPANKFVSLDIYIHDSAGHKKMLPSVIYTGRYWYTKRANHVVEPYIIYKRVKSQKTLSLDYTVTIPHEDWMNHASLSIDNVQYDCCAEWLLASKLLVDDINVDPNPTVEINPELYVWRPDPALAAKMVGFMTPEVEGVKHRAATVQLFINYPVNVYKVIPTYMNNPTELPKVDTMMNKILDDKFITINSYSITGFASPEGRLASNEALARNRSFGFKTYMQRKFNFGSSPIKNEWVGEDWESLAKAINESEMQHKEQILNIINTTPQADARDAKIKALDGGRTYNELLKDFYPPLRRIELRANYTVRSFTDEEARDLIFKRPELLSLDEIYRVALFHKPGTKEYREIYELAARHFPRDVIANNNAAAAILIAGDTDAAVVYLDKIKDDPRSYVNRGVIAYLKGDLNSAETYFRRAAEAGFEVGTKNLELLENAKK